MTALTFLTKSVPNKKHTKKIITLLKYAVEASSCSLHITLVPPTCREFNYVAPIGFQQYPWTFFSQLYLCILVLHLFNLSAVFAILSYTSSLSSVTRIPALVRHPSQLPPEQRHVYLVKYFGDTRPKNQIQASKQQHHDLCCHLSRAAAQVTFHIFLLGVDGVIHTPYTLEPLKELGLDTHTGMRIKLDLKLYAHSVQYAYKQTSTRRALENTPFNSQHRNQARATASNLPDPH
eukprot:1140913-Pelagomonas_calceolata.AAC.8